MKTKFITSLSLIISICFSCTSNNNKATNSTQQTKRLTPWDISYTDQLDDSIRFYKLTIDKILEKNIARMTGTKDSSTKQMLNILIAYKNNYKNEINRTGKLMYLASGLNKDNFRNQKKMEFYSLITEYEKLKAILTEICGNYFEAGVIVSDSINSVPACLYDFNH